MIILVLCKKVDNRNNTTFHPNDVAINKASLSPLPVTNSRWEDLGDSN